MMPEAPAEVALDMSRRHCRQITRRSAHNFYYALRLLREPKRSDMYALYAWMRLADDIADSEDGRDIDSRSADLQQWRISTHSALEGRIPQDGRTLWPAFSEMARRRQIPWRLFDAMIAGQEQDLRPVRIGTFEELHDYCYRVAGVVGVASLYVWGFEGGEATEELAVQRGVAFQLTNILRDLREDAGRGRMYLPQEELAEAQVNGEDLQRGVAAPGFLPLLRRQIERAERYYAQSAPLEQYVEPDSRPALRAMTAIYHGLLERIAARPQRVLERRVSLSLPAKLWIGWRALLGRS